MNGQLPTQQQHSSAALVVLGALLALAAIGVIAVLYLAADAKSDLEDATRQGETTLNKAPYAP